LEQIANIWELKKQVKIALTEELNAD